MHRNLFGGRARPDPLGSLPCCPRPIAGFRRQGTLEEGVGKGRESSGGEGTQWKTNGGNEAREGKGEVGEGFCTSTFF